MLTLEDDVVLVRCANSIKQESQTEHKPNQGYDNGVNIPRIGGHEHQCRLTKSLPTEDPDEEQNDGATETGQCEHNHQNTVKIAQTVLLLSERHLQTLADSGTTADVRLNKLGSLRRHVVYAHNASAIGTWKLRSRTFVSRLRKLFCFTLESNSCDVHIYSGYVEARHAFDSPFNVLLHLLTGIRNVHPEIKY